MLYSCVFARTRCDLRLPILVSTCAKRQYVGVCVNRLIRAGNGANSWDPTLTLLAQYMQQKELYVTVEVFHFR